MALEPHMLGEDAEFDILSGAEIVRGAGDGPEPSRTAEPPSLVSTMGRISARSAGCR